MGGVVGGRDGAVVAAPRARALCDLSHGHDPSSDAIIRRAFTGSRSNLRTTMSEREAEDWLIRYLVVMVVAATALLMLIYGLVFAPSMAVTAGALVALAAVSAVIIVDLRSWRTA